jgi:hypothetical protein
MFVLALCIPACAASVPDDAEGLESPPRREATGERAPPATTASSEEHREVLAGAALDGVGRPACEIGAPADGRCQVAYEVHAEALRGVTDGCARVQRFSCEGKSMGFAWTDQGNARPTSVTIAVFTSVFCGADPLLGETQEVSFNGDARIGSIEGDRSACTCEASGTEQIFTLDPATIESYEVGAENELRIAGPNVCLGVRENPEWNDAFARIVVRY